MNFQELAKARYSVRKYKDTPIEEEKLSVILEAGRIAPTACNLQPQRVYVVRDPQARAKLASVCRCTFDAPVIIVMAYDRTRDWKNKKMPGYESGETDAAIVATHMMLQAWELGIGSCWVGLFNADQIAEALGLPENVQVSSLLPLGYPAEDALPLNLHTQYRPLEETVTFI